MELPKGPRGAPAAFWWVVSDLTGHRAPPLCRIHFQTRRVMISPARFTSLFAFSGALTLVLLTRLIPHWPNFTAVGAFALGSAVWFGGSRWNGLLALASLYATDLVLNNTLYSAGSNAFSWGYSGMVWTYSAWALLVVLGSALKVQRSWARWTGGALIGSVLFFVVTNTGSWLGAPFYEQTFAGWLTALVAGLPFAANFTLSTWLFGAAAVAVVRWIQSFERAQA